jgi:hypothetical protein
MLRAILLIVALLIILAIGAVATGLVDVTKPAQERKINVKVNDVDVGTAPANVQMPSLGTTTKQIELPNVTIDKGAAQPAPQPATQPGPQGNTAQ